MLHAGKLLSDQSRLTDFLSVGDCEVHTLHLSCSLQTASSHAWPEQTGDQNTDIDQALATSLSTS